MQLAICVDLLRVVIKKSNEVAHATWSHPSHPKNNFLLLWCIWCSQIKSFEHSVSALITVLLPCATVDVSHSVEATIIEWFIGQSVDSSFAYKALAHEYTGIRNKCTSYKMEIGPARLRVAVGCFKR